MNLAFFSKLRKSCRENNNGHAICKTCIARGLFCRPTLNYAQVDEIVFSLKYSIMDASIS